MRLLDIIASDLKENHPLGEMPGWMHAYPKNPRLPYPIDQEDRRGFKKISSTSSVDVWFNKKTLDIYVTPTGSPVTENVGYVLLYGIESFAGAQSYQATQFAPAVVVTDVFLDPKYRGAGLGKFIYQSLMKLGYTIASATSVNPNSQGLWKSLVTDASIHTWAMHPRGKTAYPLKDVRGRLEPQVGSSGEDVDFAKSVWYASLKHNPLRVNEAMGGVKYYHVTDQDSAEDILKNGFLGGWGDVGFGVYFYGDIYSTQKYAAKGGWDGHLKDPVILQVYDPRIEPVNPHPDWNAEEYANMYWMELDEDDEDAHWMPNAISLLSTNTMESTDTKTVYHVTFAKNLRSIKARGLEPRIGKNSTDIGEKQAGVHVFFDWNSMEDAATNWDMDWHDDEDAELVVLTLEVPSDWVQSHWETYNTGTGIVMQSIPASMIKAVKRNF